MPSSYSHAQEVGTIQLFLLLLLFILRLAHICCSWIGEVEIVVDHTTHLLENPYELINPINLVKTCDSSLGL